MATAEKNLDEHHQRNLSPGNRWRVGLVVAEWNEAVTEGLRQGAQETLLAQGLPPENLSTRYVPGSFELSLGSQWLAQHPAIDAVIALGCVVRGETPHFDYICQAVAYGVTEASLKSNKPVVFGVLTTENQNQALERAGGRHGNKGSEAAITALKMLNF